VIRVRALDDLPGSLGNPVSRHLATLFVGCDLLLAFMSYHEVASTREVAVGPSLAVLNAASPLDRRSYTVAGILRQWDYGDWGGRVRRRRGRFWPQLRYGDTVSCAYNLSVPVYYRAKY
jgi:hypothetical protein